MWSKSIWEGRKIPRCTCAVSELNDDDAPVISFCSSNWGWWGSFLNMSCYCWYAVKHPSLSLSFDPPHTSLWFCFFNVFFHLITYFLSLFTDHFVWWRAAAVADPSVTMELALDLTFVSVKQQLFLSVFQASLSSCFLLLCAVLSIVSFCSFYSLIPFLCLTMSDFLVCWNSISSPIYLYQFLFLTRFQTYLTCSGTFQARRNKKI